MVETLTLILRSHLTFRAQYYFRAALRNASVSAVALLPSLRSISFQMYGHGLRWDILKPCFELCHLVSLTFDKPGGFTGIDPYPNNEIAIIAQSLRKFSYTAYEWRDLAVRGNSPYQILMNYPDEIGIETKCMAALVLGIRFTVESLCIPWETAPLTEMSQLSWPRLQQLSLRGIYRSREELAPLRQLIFALSSNLSNLCVEICPARELGGRLQVFGKQGPGGPDTHPPSLPQLRSLVLAYPDPGDFIFDAVGTQLTHLSISDFPRFYYHRSSEPVGRTRAAPMLSSSECLSILKRLSLRNLTRLSLVYIWDEEEDNLLAYATQGDSIPQLSHLELHRHRQSRHDIVPHVCNPARIFFSYVLIIFSETRNTSQHALQLRECRFGGSTSISIFMTRPAQAAGTMNTA